MNIDTAEIVVLVGSAYALFGVVFGIVFVTRGVHRIDPAAVGARWPFRVIILPGVAALWPLLLARWLGSKTVPEERTAHRSPSEAVR